MNKFEEKLKQDLYKEADRHFTEDTMKYIKRRDGQRRIIIGLIVFIISLVAVSFIPYEALRLENLPFINKKIVISKDYVFLMFTFSIILFLDSLYRNILATKRNAIKT